MKTSVVISIVDGRTVRDLLFNDLHKFYLNAGYDIHIFTEGYLVKNFTNRFHHSRIHFHRLYQVQIGRLFPRFYSIRRLIRKFPFFLYWWWKFEEAVLIKTRNEYITKLKCIQPRIVLSTHSHVYEESELLKAAHILGIPTLGLVRSWDNVHKGIKGRPRYITAWNNINRQELIDLEGYDSTNVFVTGAPQFDQYFKPDNIVPRRTFLADIGLHPDKPIIFFATLGYFFPGNDETEWMTKLLELISSGAIPESTQVICRLHPWSKYEHFVQFKHHKNVIMSFCDKYWPALTWYMDKEDVITMANMLAHSDMIITPASTVALEAAIFNKPTIIPIFHTTQPERMKEYFEKWQLTKHYGRIKKLGLIPFIENEDDYAAQINKCLNSPNDFSKQRKTLLDEYVKFTDGRSTTRIFELSQKLGKDFK